MPIIIWDNASIHYYNYTKKVINNLKFEIRSLPPYCPEIAPVEHIFRAIKAKLRSKNSMQTFDFGKQSGVERIRDCAIDIRRQTLQGAWTEVIREWSDGIKSARLELSEKI